MTAMGGIPTERQVQRAILSMMGRCFPNVFVTHIPNGAHLAGPPTARFKQMGALRGDGLKPGFPDLLCLWARGNRGALLEVKRPKGGVVSDAQRAMHERLDGIGWTVAIVTSPQEAFDHLKLRGAPWNGTSA